MQHSKIAFIGAGNMARSIIGGLVDSGTPPETICASAPGADNLIKLTTSFGIRTTHDNKSAVMEADIVVLAVKPQMMQQVCTPLAEHIPASALIISVAAGLRCSSLDRWLGGNRPIIRCMPNTPALIGLGASGLYANTLVSKEQMHTAERLIATTGVVEWVSDESLIDSVTAVSGSGPAYFFLFLEAMTQAGVEQGLTHQTSKNLAIQTALGAATLAQQSDSDLVQLRKNVTSPGGTTEQAIHYFENNGLRELIKMAMAACRNRAKELADQTE